MVENTHLHMFGKLALFALFCIQVKQPINLFVI